MKKLLNSWTAALGAIAVGLAAAALLFARGNAIAVRSDADVSSTSVMIVRTPGGGGGTGSVVETGDSESKVLTNLHVCRLVERGGVVITDAGASYQVISYQASKEHDLCLVSVAGRLTPAARLAQRAPEPYGPAAISGHPHLLPNVVTRGHFSGHDVISVVTYVKPCSEQDMDEYSKSGNGVALLMCSLLGGIPQVKSYDAQLVSATIMPGSSGSAVFDKNGEIAGVVFAGSGDLGYAWIVPYEAVSNFLRREALTAEKVVVDNTRGIIEADDEPKGQDKAEQYCSGKPSDDLSRRFCSTLGYDMVERGVR